MQTVLVDKAASILSDKLKVDVKIESVNIALINKVVLNGVYIQDYNQDTLIYVNKLSASILKLPIWGNELKSGTVTLNGGIFNLRSYDQGMNIAMLVRSMKDTTKIKIADTTKIKRLLDLSAKKVVLEDFRFRLYRPEYAKEENIDYMDYANLNAKDIQIDADQFRFAGDTIFFTMNKLSLKEKSGFNLHHLRGDAFIIPGKEINVKNFKIIDDYSDVLLDSFSMKYNGGEEFKDFVNKVVFDAGFSNSSVSFKTIGFFAQALKKVDLTVLANGSVTGPIANLRSPMLTVKGANNTNLSTRFSLTGLPNIDETIIYVRVNELTSSASDVFYILEHINNTKIGPIKENLSVISYLQFNGSYEGLYNDFVAHGKMHTNIGQINLDLLFGSGKTKGDIDFDGYVGANNFNLGRLLKSESFDKLSLDVSTNGTLLKNGKIEAYGKGAVKELLFKNYSYHDIEIDGNFAENKFKGEVTSTDPNCNFDFLGEIDISENNNGDESKWIANFKANINHVDLALLNLNTRDSVSIFRGILETDFKKHADDGGIGTILAHDIIYTSPTGDLSVDEIRIFSESRNKQHFLEVRSDFMDADFLGSSHIINFITDLRGKIYEQIPNLEYVQPVLTSIKERTAKNKKEVERLHTPTLPAPTPFNKHSYTFDLRTKNTINNLTHVLLPGLSISSGTTIDVKVDSGQLTALNLNSKAISLNEIMATGLYVNSKNTNQSLNLNLRCQTFNTAGIPFNNLYINNIAANNTVNTSIQYDNMGVNQNKGEINLATHFSRYEGQASPSIEVSFKPSHLFLNDTIWHFAQSKVKIDTSTIKINNFGLYNGEQKFDITGTISKNTSDTLRIQLHNLEIANLNSLLTPIGYDIHGIINGGVHVNGLYGRPIIGGRINLNNTIVNNHPLGDLYLMSFWDNADKSIKTAINITNQKEHQTQISGKYSPYDDGIDFRVDLDSFPIGLTEPFIKDIVSNISGYSVGNLYLKGTLQKPLLTGQVRLNDTKLTVNYLNTIYTVNADANFSNKTIIINGGQMTDEKGNTATINATLNHNAFRDINFSSTVATRKLQFLNTREKDNPMFYGNVFASGIVDIKGTFKDIEISATARTEDNSKLYIPLPSSYEARQNEILNFTTSVKRRKFRDTVPVLLHEEPVEKARLKFNLDLAATDNAEVQILVDPKAGEILKGIGTGNIRLEADTRLSTFNMFGEYTIEKGDYTFVLPNFDLISRKFTIETGSSVKFNGEVTNSQLDVTAIYLAKASIGPLLPLDSTSLTKRKIPIDCKIRITGSMLHPNIKPDIEIENIDSETLARVKSTMNTDDKLLRQFISLLVLGQFMPDQENANVSGTTVINATELLSNQISMLISQFNLPFNVNVDYRRDSESNHDDVEIDVDKSFFDGRLIVNGSVANNKTANRNFVGDYSLEYLMDKTGRLRFKAYSISNDYYTNAEEGSRQGVEVSYRGSFDSFSELFRQIFGGNKKQREAVAARKESEQEEDNKEETKSGNTEQ